LARFIFNKHDDALLRHEYDDNQKIEPTFYVPIIPMVLVNGADGIGTGWMTKIPNYNPREIIENLLRMMEGADPRPMVITRRCSSPWFSRVIFRSVAFLTCVSFAALHLLTRIIIRGNLLLRCFQQYAML
jgi:hypothetical protein